MKWVVKVLVDIELNEKFVVQESGSRKYSGICYCESIADAQQVCDALNAMEATQ